MNSTTDTKTSKTNLGDIKRKEPLQQVIEMVQRLPEREITRLKNYIINFYFGD